MTRFSYCLILAGAMLCASVGCEDTSLPERLTEAQEQKALKEMENLAGKMIEEGKKSEAAPEGGLADPKNPTNGEKPPE